MNTNLVNIVKRIAEELNLEYHLLSNGWLISLKDNNKKHYIVGFKFDLNSQATGQLCDDKYALYSVLKDNNIPVSEHVILFNHNTMKDYLSENTKDKAYRYFNQHNNNVVLKANLGTCGTQVYHVRSVDGIDQTLDKLFINNNTISICPFYHIKNEYRIIYLNGKCELIYGKIKPEVIGDGQTSLINLFKNFNEHYFNKKNILPPDGYDWEYIPNVNEAIEYNWKFNLSSGASVFIDISGELKERLITLANMTAKSINLRFGSIDIIETEDNELLILEINSGVMMENVGYLIPQGQDIVYRIYKKAIQSMFQ